LTRTPSPGVHQLGVRPFGDADADEITVLLNVRRLVADLAGSFDRLESELREDDQFCEAFERHWIKGRTRVVRDPTEVQAWERLLGPGNSD
jgi:hypothetical protein